MDEKDNTLSDLAEAVNQDAARDRMESAILEGRFPDEKDRQATLGNVTPISVEHREASQEMREAAAVRDADDLLDELFGDMKVSMDEAKRFIKPEWLYPDLFVEGHIVVSGVNYPGRFGVN